MGFFRTRRFFPLFVTQFMGAFNDNLLKNALVMLVTYKLASKQGMDTQQLVTIAGGLFMLPFFLFSATAGQVSDKFSREKITRIIKLVEIFIMVFAAIGFYSGNIWFLLFVLFMMGVHSTFFGPIKFALLPQHLNNDELLLGNAYIEAGTFLAILIGTILGILILQPIGVELVSGLLLAAALTGYISSRYIPESPAPEPELAISKNIWKETWRIVGFARENKRVFLSILGISWFWLVGATYLSQFPAYAKDILSAEPDIVTMFLTIFSIGVGTGSFLCNKLLKGEIKSTYVPISMLGITIFGADLYFATIANIMPAPGMLMGISEFLSSFQRLRILFDLLLIAICSGLYIVPLYAIMQHSSSIQHRARIIAANNVMNAIFMVASALIVLALLSFGFNIPQVFLVMAVANGFVAFYIWRTLPGVREKYAEHH